MPCQVGKNGLHAPRVVFDRRPLYIALGCSDATAPRSLASFTAVAAGDALTCALGADRRVYCWGLVPPGQSSAIPVAIPTAPAFASISTSQRTVCGVSVADDVWCWGRNDSGQLGVGTMVDRPRRPASRRAAGRSRRSAAAVITAARSTPTATHGAGAQMTQANSGRGR